MALAVATGDMSGNWPLATTTGYLSDFADAALQCATSYILRQAAAKGVIELPHPDTPQLDSGFIIIGMGKLGARELNYSSDIDLIVLFDPYRMQGSDPTTLHKHCVRMTRDLVRIIDERTPDGYVFRTDLRLRPDPGATPIAVSMPAAEAYYESQGQNWERAAMIKARPVAGDLDAGREFLQWLRPFIWRKNLDFAAIQDIQSIKRQINAHRGGSVIAVEGHNIKLGRGGIREIEFFAQTQQLIWGGRETPLRTPSTVAALSTLAEHGHIKPDVAETLTTAYEFLRQTEHRLQMVNDEQTQTLPVTGNEMERLAIFMGHDGRDAFATELIRHLKVVEDHYAALFEDAPALSASGGIDGNLVFTGSDADPDTLDTIRKFGFESPETVDTAIRGWHHGRYRAMRSTRAREMLTELTPALLDVLGGTPEPDATFIKFDEFVAGLPAGVQLFSMLYSNPQLLSLLAEIMGEAPRLAEHLSRRPSLFDSVLSSDFLDPPPSLTALTANLSKQIDDAEHFEQVLDIARRWTNERRFQIGLQSLRGMISPPDAAWALSDMAEATLQCLFPAVETEFATQHGRIPGARFCTIALGKLGGHEMTPTSDLDLVFVYDVPPDTETSDGNKPLVPTQYFARLGQRYINAIMSPTAEGILYEVDMRLRPSGNAGPIACTLDAFIQYHEENAWTWERLALTRDRTVLGDEALRHEVDSETHRLLAQPCDEGKLLADVAEMRARMDTEHHTESPWSIKHLRGGLIDLEFIIQYLQLRYAAKHPSILSPNTWRALRNLKHAGLITDNAADILSRALDLWQAFQSRLHLTIDTDAPRGGASAMPIALQERFAKLGGADNLDGIEAIIRTTAAEVFGVYMDIIGNPITTE
ncbi:MAG: bifunctional [glutamine synthetase] adenylyltransferase/[glutamine synthetase]-adenylyl-L-tyrosine phosphorylase [Alphaproteobacteria bacterium]|nr:bifunctional [glutamine synthetase] adenylyltransferase/[glutamine synthetase]-adenylyl-L-tyrosine phosphorylase [Alphaproteobacteria bacterium]